MDSIFTTPWIIVHWIPSVTCCTSLLWRHGCRKKRNDRLFIRALETEGITIVYGEFKRKDKRCLVCEMRYSTFEEKQTDVNIAIPLLQLAIQDRYDRAVIVSGDTDLIPAIKAVRVSFPDKRIGIMIPIGGSSEDLKKHADFHFKMKEHHLMSSRFPNSIKLPSGATLDCPASWRQQAQNGAARKISPIPGAPELPVV
jgi:uncharacterized LabA/DUF88 family protein